MLNDECWDLHFWHKQARDEHHFSVYERIAPGPDPKLLYDSYLWKLVIRQLTCLPTAGRVLELLPGDSRTIPLALESLSYSGRFDRLDLVSAPLEALAVSFPTGWIEANVLVSAALGEDYSLILGNHILDDLLAYLHVPDPIQRRQMYLDPDCAKDGWEAISASNRLRETQEVLARAFVAWTTRMRPGALLLLRHYPPTCALRASNIARINTELMTFSIVVGALQELAFCRVELAALADLPVPMGSRFPGSFLAVRRL